MVITAITVMVKAEGNHKKKKVSSKIIRCTKILTRQRPQGKGSTARRYSSSDLFTWKLLFVLGRCEKTSLLVSIFLKGVGREFQNFAPVCREGRLTKRGLVHWGKSINTDGGLCVFPMRALWPYG